MSGLGVRDGNTFKLGALVTGDPEDEIRRSVYRLAGRAFDARGAARLLGVCDRTFRRQIDRYETDGMDGLIDKRLAQLSHKRAPVDEVIGLVDLYRRDYVGWNVKHFHAWYAREHDGQRGYTWVKNQLQQAGVVGLGETCGAGKIRASAQGAETGIR